MTHVELCEALERAYPGKPYIVTWWSSSKTWNAQVFEDGKTMAVTWDATDIEGMLAGMKESEASHG